MTTSGAGAPTTEWIPREKRVPGQSLAPAQQEAFNAQIRAEPTDCHILPRLSNPELGPSGGPA